MTITFNHTIIAVRDRDVSARFYRDLFDRAYARLCDAGAEHWPTRSGPASTTSTTGTAGDPTGHYLEMITRPYL
ncbi:MAG: hypothetical protein L0H64_21110 [Pseudonocardia sp.]|nr:hypothetical protein [Pseudonocardia sp.]